MIFSFSYSYKRLRDYNTYEYTRTYSYIRDYSTYLYEYTVYEYEITYVRVFMAYGLMPFGRAIFNKSFHFAALYCGEL